MYINNYHYFLNDINFFKVLKHKSSINKWLRNKLK